MKSRNLAPIFSITTLLLITLSVSSVSFAKKGGNGGGNGGGKPPPPLPEECQDEFPGFSYQVEATRRSPGEIWLASSDGCRRELVAVESDDGRGIGSFHVTADKSKGVILFKEEPDDGHQYVVIRQDFTQDYTVDTKGVLNLETAYQLFPLSGEDLPAEDELYFFNMDIWGDDTHEALYLAVERSHFVNSGSGESTQWVRIYNLNDMSDWREVYNGAQVGGEWNCPAVDDVDYHQFVPGCYRLEGFKFNPSGTRLYISARMNDKQGQRWDGELRIHINRIDAETGGVAALANWTFSAPELIYTGTDAPSGNLARLDNTDPLNLPSPEFLAIRLWDAGMLLDADQCALAYSPFADGSTAPADINLWETCLDPDVFTELSSFLHEGGDSWQSSDALLFSRLGKRHYDIYRRYIAGPFSGTEELLIENARGADTGL